MTNSAPSATWNEPGAGNAHGLTPGLHAGEFRPLARHGFGDPCNAYPHTAAWFRDRLYVGTTRCVLLLIQMRTENMSRWKSFPVRPAVKNAHAEYDTRGQIWRYTPATGAWDKLLESPRMPEQDGVAWPMYHGTRGMIVYRAPAEEAPSLYLTTWSPKGGPGVMLLRSQDGERFENVPLAGIEQERYSSIRALEQFKGQLFCSPGSLKGVSQNMADVVRIYATPDPLREPWRVVAEDNFGDGHNEAAADMAVFNGHLYVGTRNPRGFEIWKTDAAGAPPYRWQRVVAGGAGRGPLNETVASLCVFNGALYAGTSISNGGYDRDHGIGPGACEIVRVYPDDSYDVVMGDMRTTPRGFQAPLSGYGPGFDNPCNAYLWRLCAHDGWLYAGTFCASSFLPFLPSDRGGEMKQKMIESELPRIMEASGGFDLWRSRDGVFWTPVTRTGFGNEYNYGVRSLISTPLGLVVGAANPFAPEVGKPRAADWRFEPNPRGGLEIWLGTPQTAPAQPDTPPPPAPARREDAEGNEAFIAALVAEFFEGTAARTLGFWDFRTRTPAEAFDNLMWELLAFLPETLGDVLVLDADSPAPGEHLLRVRPPASLRTHVTRRRETSFGRHAVLLERAAPPLSLPDNSLDAVLNVQTLSRNRRGAAWLKEIRRLLKPGGRCALMEILSEAERAPWRTGRRRPAVQPEDFEAVLAGAGFDGIRVLDVTESCRLPFRRQLDTFIRRKMLDNELDQDLRTRFEQAVTGAYEPISAVILASGGKEGP
ncbi:MAG: methyltransferase domain-containing protein [Lentisphaerae bacterium]|nr:methyltransferase domain-containing protein [Lentisphaerota bacterium]